MSAIEAAALYVGLFAVFMLALKMNVGRVRVGQKISFGDNGNEAVQRAVRVQGNAVEDVPFALAGLIALGLLSAPVLLIHGLGAGLLVSRILHAVGLGRSSGTSFGRAVGTLGTAIVLLVTAVACVWLAVA